MAGVAEAKAPGALRLMVLGPRYDPEALDCVTVKEQGMLNQQVVELSDAVERKQRSFIGFVCEVTDFVVQRGAPALVEDAIGTQVGEGGFKARRRICRKDVKPLRIAAPLQTRTGRYPAAVGVCRCKPESFRRSVNCVPVTRKPCEVVRKGVPFGMGIRFRLFVFADVELRNRTCA